MKWTLPVFDPENHPIHGSSRSIKTGASPSSQEELSFTGSLDFGEITLSDSKALTCTFTNTGERSLDIVSYRLPVNFDYRGFIPRTLTVGNHFIIIIRLTPIKLGTVNGNVVFKTKNSTFIFPSTASVIRGDVSYNGLFLYNGIQRHNGVLSV